MSEIERKFLVSSFPKSMHIHRIDCIRQIYLDDNTRVRAEKHIQYNMPVPYYLVNKVWEPPYGITSAEFARTEVKYFYTTKRDTDNGLVREEINKEIDHDTFFYVYIPKCNGLKPIEKSRYHFYIGDKLHTMDCFLNPDIEDIVEVEFETIEEANKYIPPIWFDVEVTYNDNYKNKNIFKLINKE